MMPAQQARARDAMRRTSRGSIPGSSAGSVIPFDHAASFELTGIPGNIIQDVINISTDGVFVADSIGYGFEEDRGRRLPLIANNLPPTAVIQDITLDQIPPAALIEGFRLNPSFGQVVFEPEDAAANASRVSGVRERRFSNRTLAGYEADILQGIKPAEEISFLFSIVDSATGRELQDAPTHNLASLGKSNGARPFRMLAQPLTFQPRSTMRLQIVERSEGVRGTLFIVFYGFKILGAACPEPMARGASSLAEQTAGSASDRVIPFDYVASFQLQGSPGTQVEDEVTINVEGGFVATNIGYGLAVESLDVQLTGLPTPTVATPLPTVPLGGITLGQFSTSALQGGIRIRPNFLRVALNGGNLNTVSVDLAQRIFESLNRPDDVSFRYSFLDTGTGRELQNQPINNVAGLGIANGDRPFKRLSRPMMFLPRSTIRINIEEVFGKGKLYITFQGYKILSGNSAGAVPAPPRRGRR